MSKYYAIIMFLFMGSSLDIEYDSTKIDLYNQSVNKLLGLDTNPVIVDFIPYSPYEIDRHMQRIEWAVDEFREEANLRKINVENPMKKFTFSMRAPVIKNVKITGFCWVKEKKIFLKIGFTPSTLFHELGHCEFNYSHRFDSNVAYNKKSKYIMNWSFNTSSYVFDKKVVLDDFFNKKKHRKLGTVQGKEEHQAMLELIETKKQAKASTE